MAWHGRDWKLFSHGCLQCHLQRTRLCNSVSTSCLNRIPKSVFIWNHARPLDRARQKSVNYPPTSRSSFPLPVQRNFDLVTCTPSSHPHTGRRMRKMYITLCMMLRDHRQSITRTLQLTSEKLKIDLRMLCIFDYHQSLTARSVGCIAQ